MLFIAILYGAVFMPCCVVFGVVFLRPSENPFERIIGWFTLGMAVWCSAIGQMVLDDLDPPSGSVLAQLIVGIALIGIAFRGLPAANRSLNDLADEMRRKVEEVERAETQSVQH